MATSTDELLFGEQATTSLYERFGNPGERRVLPLRQAEPVYSTLDSATRGGATPTPAGVAAPEIVVQVRKRNGKTDILIDGYVSNGTSGDDENVTNHYLVSHRGMHEDVETLTRVFSPIAVVAAVEDGQHSLQRVGVAVLYNYSKHGTLLEPSMVLSEARLLDHRVDDVRCNVVRVPYPLPHPAPPTLSITDNLQLAACKTFKEAKFNWATIGAVGSVTMSAMATLQSLGTLTAAEIIGTAGVVSAFASWAAIVARYAYAGGWVFSAALAFRAIDYTPAAITQLVSGGNTGLSFVEFALPLIENIAATFKQYINMKELPMLRVTKFTLSQLAIAIEGLAVRRKEVEGAPPEAIVSGAVQQSASHKQEALVWHWLADNANDMPEVDLTNMVASAEYVAQMHLRITVDDSLSCDAGVRIHNIHCKREDGPLLAAAAGGTIEDLIRLHAAIMNLESVLKAETAKPEEIDHDLWIDRAHFNPLMYAKAVTDKLTSVAKEALTSDTRTDMVKRLNALRDQKVQGIATRAKRAYIKDWVNAKHVKEARKTLLTKVVENLRARLIEPLFAPGSATLQLYKGMHDALKDRREVATVDPPVVWIRRLPQRTISTYGGYLFSAVRDTGNTYIDVTYGDVEARRHDEYHDAVAWLAACMKSSRRALTRLVPEWESSSNTRVQLRCMCSGIFGPTHPFTDAVSHSTLSLTTPVDILFAGALAFPTEHSQRRMRVIVQRASRVGGERAKEHQAASVLEALKLEHSDAYLLACHVFGDIWADELVALYKLNSHKQVEILEMASVRAAARLRVAGELLLALISGTNSSSDTGAFDDVALNEADVSLMATQPGRDAGRLVCRLLFSQNYLAVRSVMVPVIRGAARAAVRTASVFDRAVPTTLPHEACASLFGDRLDGVRAFLRAKDLSNDGIVQAAVAAAYPSVHLLGNDAGDQELRARNTRAASVPQTRSVDTAPPDIVRAMRVRLASLRMDVASANAAVASPQLTTTDQLAKLLATTTIGASGASGHFSFYVPFGFGDARPPPTLPPCAAPLFGTVPVQGAALLAAFQSIQSAMARDPATVVDFGTALSVRLEPTFDFLKPPVGNGTAEQAESVHPNVVQVFRDGGDVVVRYTASRVPDRRPAVAPSANGYDLAANAASAHVFSAETSRLALGVSAIAWNAERVVQAVVAALASADDDTVYDTVAVALVLPQNGTRASHWYTRPPNPMAIAQRTRRQAHVRRMHRVMIMGAITKQHRLMAAAIKCANDINETLINAAYDNVGRDLEIIKSQPESGAKIEYFKEKQKSFSVVFGPNMLTRMPAAILAADERVNAPYDNIDVQSPVGAQGLDNQVVLEFEAAVVAVENLECPDVPDVPDLAIAAQTTPANDAADQIQPLVAALGVGMALLAPQVQPVTVRCRSVGSSVRGDSISALVETFSNCSSLRLSEACLLASRSV